MKRWIGLMTNGSLLDKSIFKVLLKSGLRKRYKDFLLLPPDQLFHRFPKRQYCFSPWQAVPLDVNGNVALCDCQPEN